jgi:phospholipid/cholesterol/gamma-HCH transport system substrate-binding protein
MRSLELKVGILILAAVVILGGFVFVLGNFSVSKGYKLYVDFNFSGAIQAGAPVKVSGIKVGKIEDVSFLGGDVDPKTGRRVEVRITIWVQERVKNAVREDAEFFVNTAGVLGEQYLEIVPGTWDKPPLGEEKYVIGVDPPRTDLVVARLYEFLDSTTQLLHEDKDLIRNLLKNAAGAAAELNQLLVDNRAPIGDLIHAATRFADQGALVLADARAGGGVPKLVEHLDGTLVSARTTLDTLTPRAARFLDDGTRVLGLATDTRVERLVVAADNAGALMARARGAVDNLNGLLADLRAGKGTVGALLEREDIYADVKELVRDLKRNPWKFLWKE